MRCYHEKGNKEDIEDVDTCQIGDEEEDEVNNVDDIEADIEDNDEDDEFELVWKNLQSRRRCEFAHRAHKMSEYKEKILKK